jgi:hypothetical protein
VQAIWSNNDYGFDSDALAIYRSNVKEVATRALTISFPTINALVGERFFAAIVERYIEHTPYIQGDWGLWGESFGSWLAQQESLADYPYLKDCAHLDWACHLVERAEENKAALLKHELLPQHLEHVRVQYAVGTQIVQSAYPIVDIWLAHQSHNAERKADLLEKARQKLLSQQGQHALIWRPKWKAHVRAIDEIEENWLAFTLTKHTLSDSLAHISNTDFSLIDWLPKAFDEGLVAGFTH